MCVAVLRAWMSGYLLLACCPQKPKWSPKPSGHQTISLPMSWHFRCVVSHQWWTLGVQLVLSQKGVRVS